jgi:prepilin-type N-terminal cleavage/methylation domain-containing protein
VTGEGKKKAAFTLAEVLITIGIIGVVAALTIPTLLKNYQKKVTVTKLKETYAILTQAIRMSEAENGSVSGWDMPNATDGTEIYANGKTFAETYLFPYLKVMQVCNYKTKECLPQEVYSSSGVKTSAYATTNVYFSFVLINGVVLSIHTRGYYSDFILDLNGKQAPNKSGHDIFYMILSTVRMNDRYGGNFNAPGLYFYGGLGLYGGAGQERKYLIETASYACSKTKLSRGAGVYCGALIMYDGWQIRDDYPW